MSFEKPPRGLAWRASTFFIMSTIAVGMFTDLFLYGLVVPVLPFMLQERVGVPDEKIQAYVSALLAAYAGASVLFSLPVGYIADRTNARRTPFLCGLAALLIATVMFGYGQNMATLVAARILQGISAAVVWTVGLAMVMDTVGPDSLGKYIGTIFSFISVGELASPVLGGVLYAKAGYGGVFGLGAGLLAVDFLLRILVVEKKVAIKYNESASSASSPPNHEAPSGDAGIDNEESGEGNEVEPLLPNQEVDLYHIPEGQNKLIRALPILYCLQNSRLLVAFLIAFVQASLLAMFDATIPTEARSLFGFDSLKAGLLFIALDITYLILGPISGWAVDKYGTKPASVIGFSYLVPTLTMLRLPAAKLVPNQKDNIILYCVLLALNGVGMSIIGSPSIVEATDVVQQYHKANPALFGQNGPYAQLYGFNSVVFCAGLTFGPIVSGVLKDRIGYGNMSIFFAFLSAVTAVLSFFYIGGKPAFWKGKKR